jgi:hypothetical protein
MAEVGFSEHFTLFEFRLVLYQSVCFFEILNAHESNSQHCVVGGQILAQD